MNHMTGDSRWSEEDLNFAKAVSYLTDVPSVEKFGVLERSFVDSIFHSRLTRSRLLAQSWQHCLATIVQETPADASIDPSILGFYDFSSSDSSPKFVSNKYSGPATAYLYDSGLPAPSVGFEDTPDSRISSENLKVHFAKLDEIVLKFVGQALDSKLSKKIFRDESSVFYSKISDDIPQSSFFNLLSREDWPLGGALRENVLTLMAGTRFGVLLLAAKILDLKKSNESSRKVWLRTLEELSTSLINIPSSYLLRQHIDQTVSVSKEFSAAILGSSPSIHVDPKNTKLFVFSSLNELDTECVLILSKDHSHDNEADKSVEGLFRPEVNSRLSYLSSFFDFIRLSGTLLNETLASQNAILLNSDEDENVPHSLFELINSELLNFFNVSVESLIKASLPESSADLASVVDEFCKRCYSKLGSSSLPFMIASFASIIINYKYHPRKAIKRINSLVSLLKHRGVTDRDYFVSLRKLSIVCLDRLGRDREVWHECNRVKNLHSLNVFEDRFYIEYALKAACNLKMNSTEVYSWISDLDMAYSEQVDPNLPDLFNALYYAIRFSYSFGDRELLASLFPKFFNVASANSNSSRFREIQKIFILSNS